MQMLFSYWIQHTLNGEFRTRLPPRVLTTVTANLRARYRAKRHINTNLNANLRPNLT